MKFSLHYYESYRPILLETSRYFKTLICVILSLGASVLYVFETILPCNDLDHCGLHHFDLIMLQQWLGTKAYYEDY